MRIYPCPKTGKQLLCDLREEGGGRDLALGTMDFATAAVRAAERLADMRAPKAVLAPAQASLPTMGAAYGLAKAFADLQVHGPHASEAQREAWRLHGLRWLEILGDVDVNRTVWWDVVKLAIGRWQRQEPGERTGRKGDHAPRKSRVTNDTCNKRVSALSVALRTAFNRHLLAALPRFPDRLPTETVARERWCTPEELVVLARRVFEQPGPYTYEMRFGRAARIVLRSWMGMSTYDAVRLQVKAFNLVTGMWHRAKRHKTGVAGYYLPMPQPMIEAARGWLASAWVRARKSSDPILYPWSSEWRGLELYCRGVGIEPLIPHDYRRTAAHMIRLCGYDRAFCARWLALRPSSDMLDRVYLQDDPLARPDPARVSDLMTRLSDAIRPASVVYAAPRRLTAAAPAAHDSAPVLRVETLPPPSLHNTPEEQP